MFNNGESISETYEVYAVIFEVENVCSVIMEVEKQTRDGWSVLIEC